MLEDRTIQKVVPTQGQVLNNLFLAENKNGGNSPVNTLKNLKKFIPYEHFKIEGLHCLKFLPEQNDLLCKIDLKETYSLVPLNTNSVRFVRFQKSGNLCEFLWLCFELGPASRTFTKLLKVPIVPIIIYPGDMLLMGGTLPEILMGRDTLIFLLQHLDFVINLKKSILHPVKQIRVSGIRIRYREHYFGSFREKVKTRVSTMSADFHATKNFSLKSHKVNGSVFINCPGPHEPSFDIVNKSNY